MHDPIEHLRRLLSYEKEHEIALFKRLLTELSLKERLKKGYSWSNLQIVGEGFGLGEHAYIVLQRQREAIQNHQFKPGAPVSVYPRSRSDKPITGVINFVNRSKMKVVLNQKFLPDPDWKQQPPFAVDLLFDERSFREMDKAVKRLAKAQDDRLSLFRELFYGNRLNAKEGASNVSIATLNPSQNQAVNDVIESADLSIIHGPPGTGKTTTLVHAVKELLKKESQTLVCAPSNSAVDLLAERLADQNLRVIRLGNISRLDEKVLSLSLDHQLDQHPENKQIKKIRIEAEQARREARRWKRSFSQKDRKARGVLFKESKELLDWARHLEQRIVRDLLSRAQVIACTLVNAYHPMLYDFEFSTVCIDEAGQALEPAAWIAISKAQKVVLAGDPFQLPPTVKSRKAINEGLGKSLLEKSLSLGHRMSFLNVQYRMNSDIMSFSNRKFYNDALIADSTVANWRLTWEPQDPLVFIDTAGCDFEENKNPQTGSRFNEGEWYIIRELLLGWIRQDSAFPGIGIISPYRAQCEFILDELEDEDLLSSIENLSVNTIDGFQGQERDLIIISLVRSNGKGEIGFLSDYRRMNVAMTRAKKQLIIIGDSATIGADQFYNDFLAHVDQKGSYRSAWEWMGVQ